MHRHQSLEMFYRGELLLVLGLVVVVGVPGSAARPQSFARNNNPATTEDFINRYRLNSERYRVTTDDGYRLITYRLLTKGPAKGVVLLQHGLRQSAVEWLFLKDSLPSKLLQAGYEVWLGNSRASPENAGHTRFSNTSDSYWDFSFHEIGYYDMPALIDAALVTSGHKKLHLIAYSEGATSSMVLLSENPKYNAKISSINLIAPAVYMGNSRYSFIAHLYPQISHLIPALLASNPFSGSSRKQLEHYRQLIVSGRFQKYNKRFQFQNHRFRSSSDEEYNLGRVTVSPIMIHFGLRDDVVNPTDVRNLGRDLKRLLGPQRVQMKPYETFRHTDFVSRAEASQLVYPVIVRSIESTQ
ncbi:lipase 1-like [Uranotaenia lowii]|uniref:lipase 1-like n=1 Tax=Uranotaenia lowii TaxID=190385 RepID=UPI002479A6CE|nr:lipase 1-like [Uranotaenia lowii]